MRFCPAWSNGAWKVGSRQLIIEIDPIWLLRLVQLHFRPMPLGLPRTIGGQDIIAVTATFDWRTLNRLREMRGNRKRVLAENIASTRSAACLKEPFRLPVDLVS